MNIIKFAIIVLLFMYNYQISQAKTIVQDTILLKNYVLEEIIVSVNKVEESKKTVAQQIQVLNSLDIKRFQSQTTADLLSNSGNVFVQKSQLGGGSLTLRGFEASRTLLVIDGVRMNNLIYRSGHLQNVITTDNNSLERLEILFGPSSTIYGSDALGGVVHLYTKGPKLAKGKENLTNLNVFSRYGSACNESTNHFDLNLGGEKFASLTSFTFSKFGDLRGGTNLNPFYKTSYGERPKYVERINGVDQLLNNPDPFLQVQSGYTQYDLLQKFLYKPNKNLAHNINIQYSTSTNIPRYDRLTDPSETGLNYAQWYYGPQNRFLVAYDLNLANPSGKFNNIHFGVNYQNLEESRHSRKFNNTNLSHRNELVNVLGTSLDLNKVVNNHNIRFGFCGQFNTLKSTAENENISTGTISPLDTRYPNGDNTLMDLALYFSHTWKINRQFIMVDGIRTGYSALHSTIADNSFFNLPVTEVDQKNPVYSGNIGLIINPTNDWKLSFLLSTGFRIPNIDDLSKVFESAQGLLIVPNPDLKPEKTINSEIGITKIFSEKTIWETSVYYTSFIDAIVTDKFTLNGKSSILYDGSESEVYANQNKGKAFLYGFSSNIKSKLNAYFFLKCNMSYTYGRIDDVGQNLPLDHIPPFLTHVSLTYSKQKFNAAFFVNYNGWKRLENYYLNGEDNEQYATNKGMPAWFTLNLNGSYDVNKHLSIKAGVDNILDTQYRTFASGINASGRNIFAGLQIKL